MDFLSTYSSEPAVNALAVDCVNVQTCIELSWTC